MVLHELRQPPVVPSVWRSRKAAVSPPRPARLRRSCGLGAPLPATYAGSCRISSGCLGFEVYAPRSAPESSARVTTVGVSRRAPRRRWAQPDPNPILDARRHVATRPRQSAHEAPPAKLMKQGRAFGVGKWGLASVENGTNSRLQRELSATACSSRTALSRMMRW